MYRRDGRTAFWAPLYFRLKKSIGARDTGTSVAAGHESMGYVLSEA